MDGRIFVPTILNNKKDLKVIEQMISKMVKKCPECENDYFLVDELSNEINVKAFNGVLVDRICNEINITPYEFCMMKMRDQNPELVRDLNKNLS